MLPPIVERKISEIKQSHIEVVHTVCSDIDSGSIHVLSRTLTLAEASYHLEVLERDPESAKEFVVRVTTIEVYSTSVGKFIPLKSIPLGMYDDVYTTVVENSGVDQNSIIQYLNHYRGLAQQTHFQAIAYICKAFNGYTPRDVERMTIHELAKTIVLAELIHGTPFTIINPEDAANAQAKEESQVMTGIRKQAQMNDRIARAIDFSKENSDLSGAMR